MYKRDFRFSMVFPMLIAVVLFVPFMINFLGHAWYGEKHFPPLTMMKLPVDSSVISLPREIKQYKPFEITLQLNSRELARRINDIVEKSHPGTEPQGIRSEVFPEMRAKVTGDKFSIDPPEPQAQFFSGQGEMSRWSWIVTPEKTGRYHLSIELFLQTAETTREHPQVADLAEIQLFVRENPEAWMRTHGVWYAVFTLLAAGWWWKKYLAKKRKAAKEQ